MNKILLVILGVVVVGGGIAAFDSMYIVHETKHALVLQFGKFVRTASDPGLQFKKPFLENVEYFDKRVLELDPAAQEVILSDQKRIIVDSFVRYKIVNAVEFKKKAVTQINFLQVFGGRLNAAVRAEIGKILLGEMLSEKRNDVMARITEQMKSQAPDFGIEVVDVRIGRTDLPKETAQSVWAPKSALMASYSYYMQNYYTEATSNLERYLKTYPYDKNLPYAHYLEAMCYYESIEDEKRDLKDFQSAVALSLLKYTADLEDTYVERRLASALLFLTHLSSDITKGFANGDEKIASNLFFL